MEKNTQLNPEEDQQLWDDILRGKKSDLISPLLVDEEQEMWNNILVGIRAREHQKKRRRIRTYSVLAVITLLFIVVGFIGYSTKIKPDTYFAESGVKIIQLNDGSRVTLSKGARLTVEKSFPADTREVLLEGDALFEVAKSKEHPFIVHGSGYETKVLGTVFKVSQKGKTFNVDLYEGKVSVYRKGNSKSPIVLKPQQTFSNLGIPEVASVTKTANAKSVAMKDEPEVLIFNECTLSSAVAVIQKKYGITVLYPSEFANTKITFSLPNATVNACLQSLAGQFGLYIKQTDDSIFELER